MTETHLAVFKGRQIRKTLHKNELWFSVSDAVLALTDSVDPKQYIKKMRQRDQELNSCWGTICTPLEIMSPDGKIRDTNCANTKENYLIEPESRKNWRGKSRGRDYESVDAGRINRE